MKTIIETKGGGLKKLISLLAVVAVVLAVTVTGVSFAPGYTAFADDAADVAATPDVAQDETTVETPAPVPEAPAAPTEEAPAPAPAPEPGTDAPAPSPETPAADVPTGTEAPAAAPTADVADAPATADAPAVRVPRAVALNEGLPGIDVVPLAITDPGCSNLGFAAGSTVVGTCATVGGVPTLTVTNTTGTDNTITAVPSGGAIDITATRTGGGTARTVTINLAEPDTTISSLTVSAGSGTVAIAGTNTIETVTKSGNSSLTVTGAAAIGTLTQSGGGNVTLNNASLTVGSVETSVGQVLFTSVASVNSLTVTGGTAANAVVIPVALSIANVAISGGQINATAGAHIGTLTQSGGTVQLLRGNGAVAIDSLVYSGGTLSAQAAQGGTPAGHAEITSLVVNGGTFASNVNAVIDSATVNSGTLNFAANPSYGTVTVENGGTVGFVAAPGATAKVDSLVVNAGGTVNLGGNNNSNRAFTGSVTINGGDLETPGDSFGTLTVGGDLTVLGGDFDVPGNVGVGGALDVEGGVVSATNIGAGTVVVVDGTVTTGLLGSTGDIDIYGGTINTGSIVSDGGSVHISGGDVDTSIISSIGGDVDISDGNVVIEDGGHIVADGTVTIDEAANVSGDLSNTEYVHTDVVEDAAKLAGKYHALNFGVYDAYDDITVDEAGVIQVPRRYVDEAIPVPLSVIDADLGIDVSARYTFSSDDEGDKIDNDANTVTFTHSSPHAINVATSEEALTQGVNDVINFEVAPAAAVVVPAVDGAGLAKTGSDIAIALGLMFLLVLAGGGVAVARRRNGARD